MTLTVADFDAWARAMSLSYRLWFSETEDCYEIETISAAKAECFHQKRVYRFGFFINAWRKNFDAQLGPGA